MSQRSLRADEFVSLEIINDSLHAQCGFVQSNFIDGGDIRNDLAHRLALFQTFPNNHRRLVELIVSLRIQIDEYAFAAVKIRNYDMFAWG